MLILCEEYEAIPDCRAGSTLVVGGLTQNKENNFNWTDVSG